MGEVIAFVSGKGGTGKTSLCAGVALALAARGEKVLCVDCDVGLGNLDISLGLADCGALSFREVSEGGYPLSRAAVHPSQARLSFLTAPVNCQPDQIDPAAFTEMFRLARQEFAYIFLDVASGLGAGFRMAAENGDRCVVVACPDPASIRAAGRVGQALELMGKTQARLAVNRIQPVMVAGMGLTVDDVMDQTGLPLLGILPEDPNIPFAAAFGKPLLSYAKKSDAAAALDRIAQRIQGLPVRIPVKKFI